MKSNATMGGTLEERAMEMVLPSQPCLYSTQSYRRVIAELLEEVNKNRAQSSRNRAAFEAWIGRPPYEREVLRFDDAAEASAWAGQYMDYEVALAWDAWQAGVKFNER